MGINSGPSSTDGNWIGGHECVRDSLLFWMDSGDIRSYSGTGTGVEDLSQYDNDGTLTNGPTFSNGTFDFDGTNDYINFGDVVTYEFGYNTDYTLCAWFYLDGDTNSMIMSKAQSSSPYRGWYLFYAASTNFIYNALYSDTKRWRNRTDSALSTSTWYHVATTHEWYAGGVAGHTGTTYINGEEVTTILDYNTLGSETTGGTSEPFSIGMRNTTNAPFNGKIPIVQMYDKILSESEVKYNFNADRGRFGI